MKGAILKCIAPFFNRKQAEKSHSKELERLNYKGYI